MTRRARRLGRCHAILVLSAVALRCYLFAVCLASGEAVGSHNHTAGHGHAHEHADEVHGQHHHEEPGTPGSGGDDERAPVQCCNSTGVCAFTVTSQAPSSEPVFHIVTATGPSDALNGPGFEAGRRLSRAFAHGPPTYLRLATLLI